MLVRLTSGDLGADTHSVSVDLGARLGRCVRRFLGRRRSRQTDSWLSLASTATLAEDILTVFKEDGTPIGTLDKR